MVEEQKYSSKSALFLISIFILALPFSWVVLPVGGSAYRLLSILIFVLSLLFSSGIISIPREKASLLRAYSVYFALSLISLLWSTNYEASKDIAFGYILLFMVLIVFSRFADQLQHETYDKLWIIVGIIWIVLFFAAERRAFSFSSRTTIVLLGNNTDPNEYAGALVVPACVIVSQLFKNKKLTVRIMYILLLLSITYIVFWTGSRGGMLALAF